MSEQKKRWIIGSITGVTIFIFLLFGFKPDIFTDNESYHKEFQQHYSIFALPVPEHLSFAGEEVPLVNFDTRESIDRELLVNTYWQSQTLIFIKKSNRYFPIIEPILKKHNVPDDFKYLAIVESGLANSVSSSQAVGFWQFLEGTAKDFGLEINDEVDERYNLEKSTEAACSYFLKMFDFYGSWTLAAAAYNNGKTALDKQIEIQKQNNYYDLLLNEETARYIFRILAIKTILTEPDKYGFNFRPNDLYMPIETFNIEINTGISDFANFAKHFGINYKILKYFNPWLRKNYLTNPQKKKYYIKIPSKLERNFSFQEENI